MLLPVILAFVFTACSSDNEASQQPITEQNELIETGKQFAKIHNDGLDAIYTALINSKNETESFSDSSICQVIENAANSFIRQHNTQTRVTDDSEIDYSVYEKASIEDIRKNMSPREKQFVQSAISDNQDIEQLLEMVTNDTSLSHSKKKQLFALLQLLKRLQSIGATIIQNG